VICKNLPFAIEIASKGIDFTKAKITAKLLFDYKNNANEAERLVAGLNMTPLDYRVYINSSSSATIECRVKVLSSQLGSLFRVKLSVSVPSSGSSKEHACKTLMSEAVKVISKPIQQKRVIETTKKTANESIVETLTRLEQQNQDHQMLLEQMVHNKCTAAISACTHSNTIPDPDDDDFQVAFTQFLASYNSIPVEERPRKIQKVLANTTSENNEHLSQFVQFTLEDTTQYDKCFQFETLGMFDVML